jgi:hypothetical protein
MDELRVLVVAGEHLAGGDGGVQRGGELRMAFVVVGVERFLDPREVEGLEPAAHAHRRHAIPLLVRVHHQREAVAEVAPHGFHALHVGGDVGLPHLDLDAADAARARRIDVAQHLVRAAPAGIRPRCCSTGSNRGASR